MNLKKIYDASTYITSENFMSAFAPEFNNHYSIIAMPLGKVSKIEKPKFSKN